MALVPARPHLARDREDCVLKGAALWGTLARRGGRREMILLWCCSTLLGARRIPGSGTCVGLVLALSVVVVVPIARAAGIETVYNYHEVDGSLGTAGQFTESQTSAVIDAGYDLIVNLATTGPDRNPQEGFLLAQAGANYVHIPVPWESPSRTHLDLFFAVMDGRGGRRTLVHCAANFRASAFTFLYRVLREGVPEARARQDLEVVWTDEAWQEYPQWKRFVDDALRARK
jgi:protein tyrosine phosphatase (PTP) superfamily phosphohydrolase (DUF442 family)